VNKDLGKLLQRKQEAATIGNSVDWDDRRDKYIAAVNGLYQTIEAILTELIARKTVTLQRRPKSLTENFIGTYSVDDLIMIVGDEQVRFSPAGRNVVGAAGRVDVIGDRGEAMLILQPDLRWGFVQSRQPKLSVVPFDESTLADALGLVMRD
jgi:hypothetical protein